MPTLMTVVTSVAPINGGSSETVTLKGRKPEVDGLLQTLRRAASTGTESIKVAPNIRMQKPIRPEYMTAISMSKTTSSDERDQEVKSSNPMENREKIVLQLSEFHHMICTRLFYSERCLCM
ncbi:hypothetical protein Mapa_011278 [Marchantia paleacea]|nr:hypothetical protein Mapa_011278 [Marchantia paleacea]